MSTCFTLNTAAVTGERKEWIVNLKEYGYCGPYAIMNKYQHEP